MSRDLNDASSTSCRFQYQVTATVVAWRLPCTLAGGNSAALGSHFLPRTRRVLNRIYPHMPAALLHVAEERKISRVSGRANGRPEVSVVLVSDGCWQTMERSLDRVATRCRRMLAEVIAIRGGEDAVPVSLQSAHPDVRFCCAPVGSTEAQLRTIAMLEASGDIVALRRAADVGDALWLDAHFRVATGLEPDLFDDGECAAADDLSDHGLAVADAVAVEVTGQSSARRAHASAHYSVDTLPASSASSAA